MELSLEEPVKVGDQKCIYSEKGVLWAESCPLTPFIC